MIALLFCFCIVPSILFYVHFIDYMEENERKDLIILRLLLRQKDLKENDIEEILKAYTKRPFINEKTATDIKYLIAKDRETDEIIKEYKLLHENMSSYSPKLSQRKIFYSVLFVLFMLCCIYHYTLNNDIDTSNETDTFYSRYIK